VTLCKARVVSRSAPRREPPAFQGRETLVQVARDGLLAAAQRWGASGLAAHPHGVDQHPRHRQQWRWPPRQGTTRESGEAPRLPTLTRTTDAGQPLRLVGPS
jgi:hypothetical protein